MQRYSVTIEETAVCEIIVTADTALKARIKAVEVWKKVSPEPNTRDVETRDVINLDERLCDAGPPGGWGSRARSSGR